MPILLLRMPMEYSQSTIIDPMVTLVLVAAATSTGSVWTTDVETSVRKITDAAPDSGAGASTTVAVLLVR
ncbi:hypothetical protein C6A85_83635 [Mycobacterium sp. ITM-2017-0098]|nr:hypothetical protein C6A85_83635 [Mycobacterium sp. ITM-2017-0098]